MSVDPEDYGWLEGELEWFGEAGCVTVATAATRGAVAAAFGADLSAPTPEAHGDGVQLYASFLEVGGAQVVVEDNGFRGNDDSVLVRVSDGGRAASAFWNVDGVTRFGCARDGRLLFNQEFSLLDRWPGLPADLVPLAERAAGEGAQEHIAAIALAMVEQFTGVRVTAEHVSSALRTGFPLR